MLLFVMHAFKRIPFKKNTQSFYNSTQKRDTQWWFPYAIFRKCRNADTWSFLIK